MRSQTGTRGTGRIPGTPPTPSSSAPVPRTTAGPSGVWWSTEHSGGQTPWRRGSLSLSTVSLWPTTFKYHKIPLKQFTKFSPIFLLNPPPIKWNIQCIQVIETFMACLLFVLFNCQIPFRLLISVSVRQAAHGSERDQS